MKMKKLLIVVSMLAVMFSLSACDEKKDKPFEYSEQSIVVDTMTLFYQYQNISDEYAKYYIESGTEFEKTAVDGIKQTIKNDKIKEFESYSNYIYNGEIVPRDKYEIVNGDDYVSVTIKNDAKDRDVEITVKYVENPDYYIQLDQLLGGISVEEAEKEILAYGMTVDDYLAAVGYSSLEEVVEALKQNAYSELAQQGIYQYTPVEMVVSAVYSDKELMASAGRNTIIGMGTVFVVLIFISFIISLFKFLPALFAKKPKLEVESIVNNKPVEAPVAAATVAPSSDDLMNDAELVAVITAAIHAVCADNNESKDKLIVRSIRRAKR